MAMSSYYGQAVKAVTAPDYTQDELDFRGWLIGQLEYAYEQREQRHPEFDEKTYRENWENNAKAANSYVPRKKNPEDARATTGTTENKLESMLSGLLNYNLDSTITPYDDDGRFMAELGEAMKTLIDKSRQGEVVDWDVQKVLIYNELLTQGTVFVEDNVVEYSVMEKALKENDWLNDGEYEGDNWQQKLEKVYKMANTNIITGLDVFLGNIRQFHLELQPFVFIRRTYPRIIAEKMYSGWKRWKHVPYRIFKFKTDADNVKYADWQLMRTDGDMVEEIKFYDKFSNNFMIVLNGVLMFKVKRDQDDRFQTFPLSALNGICDYPLVKGDIKPISDKFAYSKSIPAKTKWDQAIVDEFFLSLILKTRKSFNPPMANNTGKRVGKSIFFAGTIHNNLDVQKLQAIGQTEGISQAELGAIQFVKSIIDEKSVSPVFEGQASGKQQTAREIIELKEQAMMKLGLVVNGVVNLHKKLDYLRLCNILHNYTQPKESIEKVVEGVKQVTNIYGRYTVDGEMDNGQTGKKIVAFEESLPYPEQVQGEEQLLEQAYGEKVKVIYLNPIELRSLKIDWVFSVIPTEKKTSALKIAMFEEFVGKLLALAQYGKTPNLDYLGERMTVLHGENPDKVFPPQQGMEQQMAALMAAQQGEQQGQMQQGVGQQLLPQQQPRPSVNTMLQ